MTDALLRNGLKDELTGCMVMAMVAVPPDSRTPTSICIFRFDGAEHIPWLDEQEIKVPGVGKVSVTTTPAVREGPRFDTVTLKVTFWPNEVYGLLEVLVNARSATGGKRFSAYVIVGAFVRSSSADSDVCELIA